MLHSALMNHLVADCAGSTKQQALQSHLARQVLLQVFQASSMRREDADLGSCKAGLACDQVPVYLGHNVRVIHRHERVGVVEVCGYDSPWLIPVLILHSSRSIQGYPWLAVKRMDLEA